MLTNDELTSFLATLGRQIKRLRKEKGLLMRDIMLKTGYYDAQWRKYEAGGSLNIASLMKVALALDVTLVDLLDGLGEWPKLNVAEIERQYGIGPNKDSERESETESEPGTSVEHRRKARSTPNRPPAKTSSVTVKPTAQRLPVKSPRSSPGKTKRSE